MILYTVQIYDVVRSERTISNVVFDIRSICHVRVVPTRTSVLRNRMSIYNADKTYDITTYVLLP